jgi:hypothetical protein
MDEIAPGAHEAERGELRAVLDGALREHPEHEHLAQLAYELDLQEGAYIARAQALAERFAKLAGTDPRWPQRARAALCAALPSPEALAARLVRDHVCTKQASRAAAARLLERCRAAEPYPEAERAALEPCVPPPKQR